MNTKTIEKQYAKLTQRERAVLILNAYGRKDEGEARRLTDSAPRVTLDAPDCGQTLMRLVNVVEWHCLKQAENAANLFLISHWADADRAENKPEADFEDNTVKMTAHRIITRADAWKIFCGELGLDLVGAFQVVSADATLLDIAEQSARKIAPDLDAIRQSARAQLGDAFADKVDPKTAEQIAAEYRGMLNAGK